MGSVIDYIDCPNCEHEAYTDFYYKTGEEYVNCQNCGYHYSATFKRDEDGEYITKDGTDNYALDNMIMEVKELKNPYGAYRIKHYDSIGYECGSLPDETAYNNIKEWVDKEVNDIELFSINRFVDGKIVTIDIIDNGPKVDGAGFSEEDRESDDLPF
jgi:Zn ribbon nucleic-acid-binding protein